MEFPQALHNDLEKSRQMSAFRELKVTTAQVDFSSNDFLGLAASTALAQTTQEILSHWETNGINGAGGSRLLNGTHTFHLDAEQEMADFFEAEATLIHQSGYTANIGLFSALLKREAVILYDQKVHASIRDGIRLGMGKGYAFKHNDWSDLQRRLEQFSGTELLYVVVESVYSMDGSQAPLQSIANLCSCFQALLIVDEAHTTGVYGRSGKGSCIEAGIADQVFARVHTFGKALGSQGAVIAGSVALKDYLVNHSRAFIYTTAVNAPQVALMLAGIRNLTQCDQERIQLSQRVSHFKTRAQQLQVDVLSSDTHVQGIHCPGNESVKALSEYLASKGFDARAIRSPTVEEGRERIRVCLHAFNTPQQIEELLTAVATFRNE